MEFFNTKKFVSVCLFSLCLVFAFYISRTLVFSQESNFSKLAIPFQVDFSEKEIKFLNSLSSADLEKLIRVIKLILEKNQQSQTFRTQDLTRNSINNSGQAPTSSQAPTSYSNSPSAQTPYYNSGTGQYQSSPAGGSSSGNPYANSANNSALQQYLNQPPAYQTPQTPLGALAQGINKGLSDVNLDVKDIDPMCRDSYGINAGGSCPDIQNLTNTVKQTAMEACTLIKKKINSQSQYRSPSCNSRVGGAASSQHMSGKALDINVNNLSTQERLTVFLKFKQKGFNRIGCYRSGSGNVHLDHDTKISPARWGPDYTSSSYNPNNCPPELIQVFGR